MVFQKSLRYLNGSLNYLQSEKVEQKNKNCLQIILKNHFKLLPSEYFIFSEFLGIVDRMKLWKYKNWGEKSQKTISLQILNELFDIIKQ